MGALAMIDSARGQEIAAMRLLADGYRGPLLASEFPETPPVDWPFSADAWAETRAYYLSENEEERKVEVTR